MKTKSNIERILEGGGFVVTSECGPPRGADPEVIRKKGNLLKGVVDAVNVTDNQTSMVRMSSLASCVILNSAVTVAGALLVWRVEKTRGRHCKKVRRHSGKRAKSGRRSYFSSGQVSSRQDKA